MSKKSTFCKNWPKFALQWGVLVAIIVSVTFIKADPEKLCPFGGLQAFVTYLVRGSLPCSMSSLQILIGLAMAAAVVLLSKLFCGYLCPIGTVEDLLIKARKGLKIKGCEVANGSILDKVLRIFKYGLLFWIVYSTATASELFCKNLDPYYAVATGFKGEITLWMSIVSLTLVILFGLFVDRFWCKYICPMGAASNSLKFWEWMLVLVALYWGLGLLGVNIPWWVLMAAWCLAAYLLEILHGKPKHQVMHIMLDTDHCAGTCHTCRKNCPYGIDAPLYGGKITSVDCTLCGECVAACPSKALSVGCCKSSCKKCGFTRFLPAILAVVFVAAAWIIGSKAELPTINEQWGVTEDMKLETVKVSDLKSVKCFGSSMAFKARMEKVPGVHGVKTYVGSHTVVVSFDPSVTNADKVQEQIFVPSKFRIWSPDPTKLDQLKIVTIRTEKMYDKMDLNYLGLQFRTTGKSIFGVTSEYACPLIVKVYMSPEENLDEEWFREVVSRKVLAMPVHGGGVKETPVDFKFVRLEPGEEYIDIKEYLEMMFDPFKAEFNGSYFGVDSSVVRKRTEVYAGKPQKIFEIADQSYEKPIVKRALPYLSNHLSSHEGVIGMYLRLNKDLVPSLQVRYAAPMTEDELWKLMTMDTWTITYKVGDVREESARMTFKERGVSYPYSE